MGKQQSCHETVTPKDQDRSQGHPAPGGVRDDRYYSAVVERALIDWESFGGTSDINRDFPGLYLYPATARDHQALWEASPLAAARRITTPTLIIHSENDLRCPISQGEQLFAVLLRNGIDVEMIRFPDEGHELSRNGAPRHRVERFEYILAWHDRHLRPGLGQQAGTRNAERST